MNDKYPRWEVFIRSKKNVHHKHAGSLHAPSEDEALLNARDVYTRRNEGISLWVIPTIAISKYDMDAWSYKVDDAAGADHSYELFTRRKAGIEHLHALSMVAQNPDEALAKIQKSLLNNKKISSIWIVKTDKIVVSDPKDASFFFEPANDKIFRHASEYDLPEGIEHM